MTSSITPSFNRRRFALTAMGGLTAVALAACGGGSDGEEASTINLREAFDKIQYRMTKEEVRSIVGRYEDVESGTYWREGDEELHVDFSADDANIFIAVRVRWYSYTTGTELDRSLNQGE